MKAYWSMPRRYCRFCNSRLILRCNLSRYSNIRCCMPIRRSCLCRRYRYSLNCLKLYWCRLRNSRRFCNIRSELIRMSNRSSSNRCYRCTGKHCLFRRYRYMKHLKEHLCKLRSCFRFCNIRSESLRRYYYRNNIRCCKSKSSCCWFRRCLYNKHLKEPLSKPRRFRRFCNIRSALIRMTNRSNNIRQYQYTDSCCLFRRYPCNKCLRVYWSKERKIRRLCNTP